MAKEIKMKNIKQTEKQTHKKKYDSKYFGIACGILSAILFLLIVVNASLSNVGTIELLKPFIPFWSGISVTNIAGGIFASFIWGWLLGYFFILFYNFFDKKFTQKLRNTSTGTIS